MILQITRMVNEEEEENLLDGVSDVTVSKDNVAYVAKNGYVQAETFADNYKETNNLISIYLLNDEGKTIKRIYRK